MLPNKSEIIHHWKLGKRKKEFSPKTNVRASNWPNSLTHPRHLTMSRYLPDVPVLHTTSPSPPPPCALTTGFWSVLPKILIVFQLSCFDPQRKMNVSQIHVKTVEDAWHTTLVVVSIVNVPWDSEGPLVKVSLISVCQILIASTDRGMNRLPFSQ